jgi:hypothetical protein
MSAVARTGKRPSGSRWRTAGLVAALVLVVIPVALLGASSLHPVRLSVAGHGVAFGRVTPETEGRYAALLEENGEELTLHFLDRNGRPARDHYIVAWW